MTVSARPKSISVSPAALAAASVGLVAILLWLGFGVGASVVLRFLAYELGFVVVPGWLVYRALAAEPGGPLRQTVLGWSLGYLVEGAAFALTARLDLRGAFVLTPVAAAVLAGPIAWARRPQRQRATARADSRLVTSVAVICGLVLLYLSLDYFTQTPLPPSARTLHYLPDTLFALAVTGEAAHHWPLVNPSLAGVPFGGYPLVHLHMAAVGQVTGIGLPLVVFRLAVFPLVVLVVLALVLAGRVLGAGRWAGPLTAGMYLLVGEIDPFPLAGSRLPFLGSLFDDLSGSLTFLLGLVFFVPAVTLLAERLRDEAPLRSTWRDWLLIALLLAGCTAAKSQATPVILAAVLLFLAWHLGRHRAVHRAALLGAALVSAVLAIFVLGLYTRSTGGLRLEPFSVFSDMTLGHRLGPHVPHALWADAVYWPLVVVASTFGLLGPTLIGLFWVARRYGTALPPDRVWLLSILVAGLVPLFLFGQAQHGFLAAVWYGLVGGAVLSAEGLLLLARRSRAVPRRTLAFVLGVLTLGVLNLPFDLIPLVRTWERGTTIYAATDPRGMTPGLYRGYRWLRGHTSPDDTLAVNVHYTDTAERRADFYYVSAFTERRVFLEGWLFSFRALELGYATVFKEGVNPFPARFRLNEAAFQQADPIAIRTLARDYCVRYLIVDKRNGSASGRLRRRLGLVFTNRDIDVFEIQGGQRKRSCPRRRGQPSFR